MSGDSRFFKLGLFVIVGIAVLVAGVVFFGAGAYFTEYVIVETATTESVEGIDVGSAVKEHGVTLGKVSKIQLAQWRYKVDDPAKTPEYAKYTVLELSFRRDMLIAKNNQEIKNNLEAAVKKGLRLRIASSGFTGPKYIEAAYLDPDKHPPQTLPFKPGELYIPCAPGEMTEIVASFESILQDIKKADIPKIAANVDKFITDTDTAVNDLKTAVLREKALALLDEAKAVTTKAKDVLANPNIDKTLEDLPNISARLRTTVERVDQIVHDPKMQKILDGVSETATNAGPASAEVRRVVRELNALLDSEREDLEAIIVSLRQVLENGAAVTEDAKSNPSRLIFGEPPPRIKNGDRK